LIVSLAAVALFGNPSITARGALAASAYYWTTLLFDLLMLFLTCVVFDATFSCLRFASKLRRAEPQWPAESPSQFNDRLQPQGDVVRDAITLRFVAARTRCIDLLLTYPSVLIAVRIVTGSTVHANYPPNLSRFIAAGMSLAVVFACAIVLRYAIDSAKGNEAELAGAKG
jgi:hypothetical protein